MGGCQSYGPVLGPYYSAAPNIQGAIILTTTHMKFREQSLESRVLVYLSHHNLSGLGWDPELRIT